MAYVACYPRALLYPFTEALSRHQGRGALRRIDSASTFAFVRKRCKLSRRTRVFFFSVVNTRSDSVRSAHFGALFGTSGVTFKKVYFAVS